MPAEKRHILFGQVNTFSHKDKLLFIKLEDYSSFKTTAYGFDAVMHGAGLMQAQYNKQLLPGSDDLPEMSKERVPHQALTEFTKLVNCFGKDLPLVMSELEKQGCNQDPLEMAKLYGIAYMTLFVKAALKLPRLPAQINLDKFYNALPHLDHMDKRTGKEVYIAKEDLATL